MRADRTESYRSLRIRLNQAWVALVICLTPGAIAAAAVSGWLRPMIIVVTALATIWAVRRAFRLTLVATPETILIRNYWRSHLIEWERVTDVFVGAAMMGIASQPAIAFRLREGKTVAAQSTPFKEEAQYSLLYRLAAIAPLHVQFHLVGSRRVLTGGAPRGRPERGSSASTRANTRGDTSDHEPPRAVPRMSREPFQEAKDDMSRSRTTPRGCAMESNKDLK